MLTSFQMREIVAIKVFFTLYLKCL